MVLQNGGWNWIQAHNQPTDLLKALRITGKNKNSETMSNMGFSY